MARIVVGLSGGVDSAVSALLLRKEGHEVIGVTLRTWENGGSRCCEIDAARETARSLGFPYHVINCVSDFKKKVKAPFIRDYLQGLTPNPCIFCNPEIKWAWMLYAAGIFKAEKIATGHYVSLVRNECGSFSIQQGKDIEKDQSYMLYRLTQEQLERSVFPLGNLMKQEVRQIATHAGLPSSRLPDSQEICFVSQGRYSDYIENHLDKDIPREGNFVDSEGRTLGRHRGIIHYTVGQRKGLGIALGYPVYVKRICAESNEVVLGAENELWKSRIFCGDIVFSGIEGLPEGKRIRANVKIRYHDRGTDAFIEGYRNNEVLVRFDHPVRAPAPGQSAVFYDWNRCVIGGGIILPDE